MTGGLFALHADMRSYAAALSHGTDEDPTPVLGSHTHARALVEAMSDQAAGPRPVTPLRDVLVLTPRHSAVAPLARALADRVTGCVEEFDGQQEAAEILRRHPAAQWVVLCALTTEVSDRAVVSLQDEIWNLVRADQFRGHLGVLIGATPEQVAWLLGKGLALRHRRTPQRRHVRIWPAFDSLPVRHGPGEWILRSEATADLMTPLLRNEHSGIVSFVAHGRDDVIHLHDTVICAKGPAAVARDAGDLRAHLPVCAYTGRCFRDEIPPEKILRADSVLVDMVFVNACMGWRIADGLFPADYLLPSGFAGGTAAAYVAAPNLVNGIAALNDMFHIALAAGASAGEATSVVNDHLRYSRLDLPYFTLLGLPWLLALDAGPQEPPVTDGLVTVAGSDRHRGSGSGGGSGSLQAAARTLGHRCPDGRPQHVTLTSPRTATVLEQFPRDDLDEPADLTRELHRLGQSMMSLEQVPLLGFRYARQGNLSVTLREQVTALATALQQSVSFGDVQRVTKRIDSLRRSVDRAERGLAQALWDRGTSSFINFDDLWTEVLEQQQLVPVPDRCPYCARSMVRLEAAHPLFPRLARTGLVCARCSVTRDRDVLSPVADILISCDETWRRQSRVEVKVNITPVPDLEDELSCWIGVHTENCVRIGVRFPALQRGRLKSGETTTVVVQAEVQEDAQMHQEYLRAFVVAAGTISIGSRPVYVRPAGWLPA